MRPSKRNRPRRSSSLATLALLGALGLGTAACAGKPFPVPPGLAQDAFQLVVVKVDRKTWSFGDHLAKEIRRGWQRSGGLNVGGVSASKSKRDFSFVLQTAEQSTTVTCALSGERSGIGSGSGGITLDSSEQLVCDLATGQAPWKVLLTGEGNKSVSGRLQQGTRELAIVPGHGGLFGPRGYFVREEQEIAAVDVGTKTRSVWFRNGLDPETHRAVAATAVVLMLYEEVAD